MKKDWDASPLHHLIGCNRRIKTPDLSCFKPVSMAPTFSVDISVSCHTIRRTRNQVRYPISLKVNFRVTGLSALIMPRLTALSTFIVSKTLLRISSPYLVVDELGDCFGVPHEIGIGRVFGRIVNEKVKIIHRDANTSVQYALLLKSQFYVA